MNERMMTPDDLKRWRQEMGVKRGQDAPITQEQAATELGLKLSTVQKYELPVRRGGPNAGRPVTIPIPVALACSARLAGLRPYPQRGKERLAPRRKPAGDVLE